MRIALIAVLLVACIGGAAVAQRPDVEWEHNGPNGRVYPSRALREGIPGYTLMCCRVLPNRRLDCDVAGVWPADQGFEAAARRLMRPQRVSARSYEALPSDARIRVGVVWRVEPTAPDSELDLAPIHEATKNICMPPGEEAAPGVDDLVVTAGFSRRW